MFTCARGILWLLANDNEYARIEPQIRILLVETNGNNNNKKKKDKENNNINTWQDIICIA